jgi:serine/threonine protein kinase
MSHAPDPGKTQADPGTAPLTSHPASDTPPEGGASLLKPGDVIPGYEILDVLGSGGMGVVYKARQTALDRLVAVKTVLLGHHTRADLIARFEQEARTVARFRHPNVVTAYDFGRHEGRLFFVMELLEGETLEDHVARRGRVEEAAAWGFVRQAAAGLAHAARLGIVHRDVKPANLFLVEPPAGSTLPGGLPMVKITDFGLVLLADPSAARLTAAGMTLGTPLYMAPEQITGGELDHRTDIYALGATAFHLLDGQPPFHSDTLWQLLAEKTRGDLPRLGSLAPRVSPASIELIAAMMAHDPAARVSSYEELIRRIDLLPLSSPSPAALAAAQTLPAPVPVVTKPLPAWRRRRGLVAALAAVLVLAGIGGTAWRWWPTLFPSTPPRPTFVASDKAQSLFDGTSLNGWQILSGGWTPAQDADKASVLSGRGVIRRPLPRWANYRVTVGIDLNKAASVDVLFGLTSADRDAPAGLVLRITPDGALLGTRSEDGGEVRPGGPLLKTSGTPEGDGGPVYREVRLERQGRIWWVYYDRKLVGTHPTADGESHEFRLAVESGTALFDTIEVVKLVSP